MATEHDHIPTVELKATGDAVVVQRVRARRAFRVANGGVLNEHADLVNAELTPVGEGRLPIRLHHGERLHLTHPKMSEEGDRLARFILDVDNTFTEDGGAGGTRQMVISEN